jgi:hypothetical protein
MELFFKDEEESERKKYSTYLKAINYNRSLIKHIKIDRYRNKNQN